MDAEQQSGAADQQSAPPGNAPQNARWSIAPTACWARLDDGTAAVMDMGVGRPLRLSLAAAAVWDVLIGDRSPADDLADAPGGIALEDVVAEVAARFGEDRETVRGGVASFLDMLTAEGVLDVSTVLGRHPE